MFNLTIIKKILLHIIMFVFALFLMLTSSISISEAAQLNNCADKKYDNISRRSILRVINHKTPIFVNETDAKAQGIVDFNLQVVALKTGNKRFYIKEIKEGKILGWINRDNLVCSRIALKANNGLPSRLIIRTEEKTFKDEKDRTNYKKITAHASADKALCHGECRQLSRFVGLFIFDRKLVNDCKNPIKDNSNNEQCFKYLIADKQTLGSDNDFIGWVSSDDIVLWNTAYALRISESFIDKEKDKYVCAYNTLEEAKEGDKEECKITLYGGWSWYDTDKRMLLQKTIKEGEDTFFKVVAPITGERNINEKEKFDFSKNLIGDVNNLRKFDVYFLLDGTKSMTSAMTEVKNTMINIVNNLPKNVQYRFAFQVYRDTYRGDKEFSDFFPLSNKCEANTDTLQESKDVFINKLETAITTTKNDKGDDSHYENLFEGLQVATRSLRNNCPDHQKLLIVIGDTGYKKDKIKISSVISSLDGGLKSNMEILNDESLKKIKKRKPILVFFLQPNLESMGGNLVNNSDYVNAYDAYTKQAKHIAEKMIYFSKKRFKDKLAISPSDYVISLDKSNSINKRIHEITKMYGNSHATSEYQSLISNGVAPFDAINQIKGDNIPARFKEQLLISSCGTDIKKCGVTRLDKIKEFYIRKSAAVVKDLLVDNNSFLAYQKLIDPIRENYLNNDSKHDKTIASLLEEVLTKEIEAKLGRKFDKDVILGNSERNMPIGDIYRNLLNIAIPDESPLFNIKLSEIQTLPDGVPQRILERLVQYSELMDIYKTSKHKVPLCGTNGTDSKEQAAKFLPPLCGRTVEQMEEAKVEMQERMGSINRKHLSDMIQILAPIGSYRLPSEAMSIYHKFGNNDENITTNADTMMWIPVKWLP